MLPKWTLASLISTTLALDLENLSFQEKKKKKGPLATAEGEKMLNWQHLMEYISVSDKLNLFYLFFLPPPAPALSLFITVP